MLCLPPHWLLQGPLSDRTALASLHRRELAGQKALLRLQHYFADAPEACGGNAAVHLTNFALHTVAARSRRQADPRMRSLSSVERLQVWECAVLCQRKGLVHPVWALGQAM